MISKYNRFVNNYKDIALKFQKNVGINAIKKAHTTNNCSMGLFIDNTK